jgi:hypothetical protein
MSILFWDLLMIATTALAFWRGRSEERIASSVIMILTALNPLFQLKSFGPRGVDWPMVSCDLIYLAMLGYFAIARRLWWAIFAAGFQSLAILIHAARLADVAVGRAAYAAAYNKYGYLVVGAILYGIWSRSRSERGSSSSSPPTGPRSRG